MSTLVSNFNNVSMIHVTVTQRIGLHTTASLIFANADVGVEYERAL